VALFVLLHGAFRGGWSLRALGRELASHGHEVHRPTLRAAGDRAHVPGPPPTLTDWIDDLVAYFRYEDLREAILVGHSHGGFVAMAAAGRLVDRVARLVFLDAPVPRDGERACDLLPGVQSISLPPADGVLAPPPLVEDPVQRSHGATSSRALLQGTPAWLHERLTPHPAGPAYEPVSIPDAVRRIPRDHVFFTRTPATYPCATTRARLDAEGAPYFTVDAGHDAPVTAPTQVAEILLAIALARPEDPS
jgi:pimeloyl-ACP methyl ester carboxylesterase